MTAVACLDEFLSVVKEHELRTRVVEEERPASSGRVESGAMSGVRIGTSEASTGLETASDSSRTHMKPAQQFHHARDVSDLGAYGATIPAAAPHVPPHVPPHSTPSNHVTSIVDEDTALEERKESSSTGWMEDDDVLEDMLDAAAAEREARSRIHALSVTKPASGGATGIGRSRPPKPAATREQRVQSSKSSVVAAPKSNSTKRGGMKLGATKTSVDAFDDDDDFEAW